MDIANFSTLDIQTGDGITFDRLSEATDAIILLGAMHGHRPSDVRQLLSGIGRRLDRNPAGVRIAPPPPFQPPITRRGRLKEFVWPDLSRFVFPRLEIHLRRYDDELELEISDTLPYVDGFDRPTNYAENALAQVLHVDRPVERARLGCDLAWTGRHVRLDIARLHHSLSEQFRVHDHGHGGEHMAEELYDQIRFGGQPYVEYSVSDSREYDQRALIGLTGIRAGSITCDHGVLSAEALADANDRPRLQVQVLPPTGTTNRNFRMRNLRGAIRCALRYALRH